MILKRILRYALLTLIGIFGFFILFILVSVGPVDRTPARELPSYEAMMTRVGEVDLSIPRAEKGFSIGFGKASITPRTPIAMAGYGPRRGKSYHHVHDSIYVRTMVVENGARKVAIVSADLLILPPTVTRILANKLADIGFSLDNTYLSATHSHNSIGHWGEGASRFIYGAYNPEVVEFIADGIIKSIVKADNDLVQSTIRSGAIAVPQAVENRLIRDGKEDPFLRVIEVHRSDSSKSILVSYSAHATCLSRGTLELSRDYPGMVVDAFEGKGYEFAMFLAGAVGSQRCAAPGNDWDCMAWMADQITGEFFAHRGELREIRDTALVMYRVPLSLNDPQVKLSEDWKLRSWLFRSAFGEYNAFLNVLRIGDIVMLGTPCDFSAEYSESLDSVSVRTGTHAIVTSFNGGYIGYVTPEKYYDIDHYETRLMNWYAPGTGDYIYECLEKLMLGVSDTR